jgi:Hint domain
MSVTNGTPITTPGLYTWSSLPAVGTVITVTLAGAGGGIDGGWSNAGGAGGQVIGTYTIPSGPTSLYIVVGSKGPSNGSAGTYGGGGSAGNGGSWGGSGGGYSGLFTGTPATQGNTICLAAGGGGSGGQSSGGAGGSATGGSAGTGGGGGGTQAAGGTGASGAGTGSALTGGNGAASAFSAGGGGGYYGGGGGNNGGGGGGSSYVTGLTSVTTNTRGGGGAGGYYAGGASPIAAVDGSITLSWYVPCFTAESKLLTPTGYKSAADIKTGHMVTTADGRQVPVHASTGIVFGTEETAPYCVSKNAIRLGCPYADLYLSPGHAFQVAEDLWLTPEAAAKQYKGVKQYGIGEQIKYYHFEAPNYFKDNLICDGTPVESLSNKQITKSMPPIYVWSEKRGGYTRWNPYQAPKRMSMSQF